MFPGLPPGVNYPRTLSQIRLPACLMSHYAPRRDSNSDSERSDATCAHLCQGPRHFAGFETRPRNRMFPSERSLIASKNG